MTERRFRLAEHLLETRPWDLFFMVEMGTDRIHHGFWRFTHSEHRLFEPGNPYEHAMLDYYRRLDAKIARLLRFADDETAVLVVSDHGAKRMDGGTASTSGCDGRGTSCCTRSRASRRGSRPTSSTGRAPWRGVRAATTAASSSTSRGASRKGVVSPDDYERVGSELKERLEALGDDQGRPIGTIAHRPEELYAEARGIAPDLLVYFGDLYWRSVGQVGTGTVHVFENDTGPDDANHATKGSTCSRPKASRRVGGRSVPCTTWRRRSSSSSASPCRPTWRGRACSCLRLRTRPSCRSPATIP
jgi:predicted AlkP superfamily phosphohydrolase/phosphomutase